MNNNMFKNNFIIFAVILATFTFLSCGNMLYDFSKNRERSKAGFEEHTVHAAGHKIIYLEAGDGETLLLVHGFGGDKDNWTRMAAHLTDEYRVVAPDLPGFGESDRIEEENYSIQNQTKMLAAFIEELGLEEFHLAGNSMGGWISAWYAVHYPGQVLTLTLLNAAGVTSPEKSEHLINLERGYNALLVEDIDDYTRLIEFMFVNPPYIPGPVRRHFAEAAVESRDFNEKIWEDIRSDMLHLEPHLGRIRAPVFILWGDTDRVIHVSSVEVFEEGIKNSESLIMKDTGHLPMIERPAKTAEAVEDFIKRN